MKRISLALAVAALIAGCSSGVKLDQPPVEDRSASSSAATTAGGAGSGTTGSGVTGVDLSASAKDAQGPQGVQRIVLLSHIGYDYDKQLAAKLRGVDVIVGGDSHTLLGPDTLKTLGVGTPGGAYPTRTADKDGKPVCVVQAWEYSQVVGELKLRFDQNGVLTECQGRVDLLK